MADLKTVKFVIYIGSGGTFAFEKLPKEESLRKAALDFWRECNGIMPTDYNMGQRKGFYIATFYLSDTIFTRNQEHGGFDVLRANLVLSGLEKPGHRQMSTVNNAPVLTDEESGVAYIRLADYLPEKYLTDEEKESQKRQS